MRLRFVASPRGNYHMTELLAELCASAHDAGHDAQLARNGFPALEPDTAYVVIPHEYYGAEPASTWPTRKQRERTIALCVENPGSPQFESLCELAPHFPRALAINRSSLAALRDRGVAAEHLQLGYTQRWDKWAGAEQSRPIDVTYLGSADARRDALVARYGRWFTRRRVAMLTPPVEPKPVPRADYLVDDEKYAHLSSCKVLINLHRAETSAFEWVRALQAIANGCVVVSEPAPDHGPLVPGQHLVIAAADSIPHVVELLLRHTDGLRALRTKAYELIRNELDMGSAAAQLAATAEQLLRGRTGRALPADEPPRIRSAQPVAQPVPPDPGARMRAAVRNLGTDTLDLRRSVQRLVERSEGRDPDAEPETVAMTPAYRDARPRVSVAITVHNYEREVLEALHSVAASEFDDYEVLVLDDASQDNSVQAARDFLVRHPWMPAVLLRNRVNRGLGAGRNALTARARGELMFVLDADNVIYPSALGRLVEALDRDPGATFAYPMQAIHRRGQPVALLSRYAWDPGGFSEGNYIDAMAMIRIDDLAALGGYTEDPRLTSWEDFHLWCSCAESGRRGRLVPQVLARYRESGHSMLALTQSDATMATSLMRSRFPEIVGPA